MLEILKRLRNQNGVGIVEAMVASLIILIGFIILSDGFQSVISMRTSLNHSFNLSQVRGKIISSVSTGNALARTIAASANMDCLKNHTDCAGRKNNDWPISVVDESGEILTDPSQAALGLQEDGSTCNGFDAAAGSDTCSFQYSVTWRPICQPVGGCMNPQNRFTGTFSFKPVNKVVTSVNLNKFNFVVFPSKIDGGLAQNCTSFGGTFNAGDGSCILPLVGLCPPAQVVIGLNGANQKICGFLFVGVCPLHTAIDRIDINGALICKPIITCPGFTRFNTFIPWVAGPRDGSGADGSSYTGDGGGDGCDGADGCDGGS